MTIDIGTFVEVDGQVFYIHENGGPGSGRRPTGATAIEIGPKKSNRIKMYRQGKKIAKEIQMRKTYYEMDIGSMVDVNGEMYYTRNNGGEGSGNFGHSGRPGEVGGSGESPGGGKSVSSKIKGSYRNAWDDSTPPEEILKNYVNLPPELQKLAQERMKKDDDLIFKVESRLFKNKDQSKTAEIKSKFPEWYITKRIAGYKGVTGLVGESQKAEYRSWVDALALKNKSVKS